MATFADFALLRAVSDCAGADLMRARRILKAGEGPAVHIALLGRGDDVLEGIARVAEATAQSAHEQVSRIHEVGRFEGEGYAVADAVDGVELAAVLEHDRGHNILAELGFSLAVALQLAQLALELSERGDVWAADGGVYLSTLFPAGLRLDGVLLRADGSVALRVLAGAGHDAARPTPFRAPELRLHRPSASSDVFLVTQLLRALLSGDRSATMAPRLAGAAVNLGGLLAAGLAANPDERLGLFMLVEHLGIALTTVAAEKRATSVVAGALKRQYRALASAGAPDVSIGTAATALRVRLGEVRAAMQVVWPTSSSPPKEVRAADASPLSAEDPNDTAVHSYHSAPLTGRAEVAPVPRAGLHAAVLTMHDELTTQTRAQLRGGEPTSVSEDGRVDTAVPSRSAGDEASSAPPMQPSEIEEAPTEVRASFDDSEHVDASESRPRPTPPRQRGS